MLKHYHQRYKVRKYIRVTMTTPSTMACNDSVEHWLRASAVKSLVLHAYGGHCSRRCVSST